MKTPADFIRPSSLHAASLCAGRPTMEAAYVNAYGEPDSSPEASMGTRAHDITAQALEWWRDSPQAPPWPDVIAYARGLAAADHMDTWTTWCIQACIEFARDLIEKHGVAPANVLIEHPLDMAGVGMSKPGTADLVLVVPFERVIITDWKFTFLDQGEATDHDQLQAYGTAGAATFRAHDVLVYLFQPRAEKAHRASGARFDGAALKANTEWTRAVVARCLQPNPTLAASYDACLYCRALTRCAAATEFIMQTHDALELIGKPTDAAAWGQLAAAAKIAEHFADNGKSLVKEHLIAGGTADGWGLQDGRKMQKLTDTAAALHRLDNAGMGSIAREAITLSLSKLPDEAREVVADLVDETRASPSLKPIKVRA
jgi:hypothetical protein